MIAYGGKVLMKINRIGAGISKKQFETTSPSMGGGFPLLHLPCSLSVRSSQRMV